MILADKIINERKKNGWSQEELAEQLSVSRQSISKWEGASAIPDIQKIIKMAEIFGVSTDYLLRDELEAEANQNTLISSEEVSEKFSARKVSLEEASEYLKTESKARPILANGVSLCILSPVLLIVLAGLAENPNPRLTENAAAGIGVVILLLMVAAAVGLFILADAKLRPYEYLNTKVIDTQYGVSGMVSEKKKAYESRHTALLVSGILLNILSTIPLLFASFLKAPGYIVTGMVGILLILVSIGVNLLVRTGGIWSSYEKLLQINDYSIEGKKSSRIIGKIASIYWLVVTAGYLCWSFWTMRWEFTWIVWPVAGVLFGAVVVITKMFLKTED